MKTSFQKAGRRLLTGLITRCQLESNSASFAQRSLSVLTQKKSWLRGKICKRLVKKFGWRTIQNSLRLGFKRDVLSHREHRGTQINAERDPVRIDFRLDKRNGKVIESYIENTNQVPDGGHRARTAAYFVFQHSQTVEK